MTISEQYKINYLDKKHSIIDSGSWLGDNSIVWSRMLSYPGKVLSIDPSEYNLNFQRKLLQYNSIKNVDLIKSALYSDYDTQLYYDGNIEHTSFNKELKMSFSIVSNTID
jgi:hypothetical protein